MRGLRTQENKEFENFFEIVRSFAEKLNSTFFLESGEGRELYEDDIEGEDLSGWLVPNDKLEKFENDYLSKETEEIDKSWGEYCSFARWNKTSDGIEITFESVNYER